MPTHLQLQSGVCGVSHAMRGLITRQRYLSLGRCCQNALLARPHHPLRTFKAHLLTSFLLKLKNHIPSSSVLRSSRTRSLRICGSTTGQGRTIRAMLTAIREHSTGSPQYRVRPRDNAVICRSCGRWAHGRIRLRTLRGGRLRSDWSMPFPQPLDLS